MKQENMETKFKVKKVEREEYSKFVGFQKKIYKSDNNFRDLQSVVLKQIINQKAEVLRGSIFTPYFVLENDTVVGVFALVVMDRLSDTLQITFLDFLDNHKIFETIYNFSKEIAKQKGLKKLLIGLNLHINYGLGLLSSGFEKIQGFGSSYNKKYYVEHIEKYIKPTDILYSYKTKMSNIKFNQSEKTTEYIKQNFEIKNADFSNIKQTAELYTKVNNLSFTEHKYYYETRLAESVELFDGLKYILKPENLLFAYYNKEPIGFILWYPEFNQLVGAGKGITPAVFLKIKLQRSKINTMKLVEFGVLPKFRNRGAIFALLYHLYEKYGHKFEYLESGWIMEENRPSSAVTEHFKMEKYKQFKVYEEII